MPLRQMWSLSHFLEIRQFVVFKGMKITVFSLEIGMTEMTRTGFYEYINIYVYIKGHNSLERLIPNLLFSLILMN